MLNAFGDITGLYIFRFVFVDVLSVVPSEIFKQKPLSLLPEMFCILGNVSNTVLFD